MKRFVFFPRCAAAIAISLMLTPVLLAADNVPGQSQAQSPWRCLPLITGGNIDAAWVQVGWGRFVVDGGALRTECDERGMGMLLYRVEKFGDCRIRVL